MKQDSMEDQVGCKERLEERESERETERTQFGHRRGENTKVTVSIGGWEVMKR